MKSPYEEALKEGLCPTCQRTHVEKDDEFYPCCSELCQEAFEWFLDYR